MAKIELALEEGSSLEINANKFSPSVVVNGNFYVDSTSSITIIPEMSPKACSPIEVSGCVVLGGNLRILIETPILDDVEVLHPAFLRTIFSILT